MGRNIMCLSLCISLALHFLFFHEITLQDGSKDGLKILRTLSYRRWLNACEQNLNLEHEQYSRGAMSL